MTERVFGCVYVCMEWESVFLRNTYLLLNYSMRRIRISICVLYVLTTFDCYKCVRKQGLLLLSQLLLLLLLFFHSVLFRISLIFIIKMIISSLWKQIIMAVGNVSWSKILMYNVFTYPSNFATEDWVLEKEIHRFCVYGKVTVRVLFHRSDAKV